MNLHSSLTQPRSGQHAGCYACKRDHGWTADMKITEVQNCALCSPPLGWIWCYYEYESGLLLWDIFDQIWLLLHQESDCKHTAWPNWNEQDFRKEDARLHFSLPLILSENLWSTLKIDSWISCIYFMGLKCNTIFSQFWMDIWTLSSSRQNMVTWICTRPSLFLWFQLKRTLQLIHMRFPVPWRQGLRFLMWTVVHQFFFPPTLNIFAHFFCSQSSISLNCIWNYRSSYHSLKRLVCPALCILAVLSNPLVWTLVSLHFPH